VAETVKNAENLHKCNTMSSLYFVLVYSNIPKRKLWFPA